LKNDTVLLDVISSSEQLLEIEHKWNSFIKKYSPNPFFLAGFVTEFLNYFELRGWTPMVLVFSVNSTLVGVAPLIIRKRLGIHIAQVPFTHPGFSPDFVFDDEYREDCIPKVFNYLFETLHCKLIYVTFPANSPTLRILNQNNCCKGAQVSLLPEMGRSVLFIEGTWDEFVKSRGKKFRQDCRRTEKYLDAAGAWHVTCLGREDGDSNAFGRILEVERLSWKQSWRAEMGKEVDQDLLMLWEGARRTAEEESDFRWHVWILELGGQPLAYALFFLFKDWCFVAKTSYDERYRRLSLGVYLINAAVRELLDEHNLRRFDFLTNLPVIKTWTSLCWPRVTVVMSRGPLSGIVKIASSTKKIKRLRFIFASLQHRLLTRTV